MGMPSVIISFSQKAATALSRRERGIIAMILKDENVPEENPFVCLSSGDIPEDRQKRTGSRSGLR